MSEDNGKNLLLLMERPLEPVFTPKGDEKVNFDVPLNYVVDELQPQAQGLLNRFGGESSSTVPVKKIAIPDLSIPLRLGRNENFSVFLPAHQEMAGKLIEIFMNARSVDDLTSLAAYCRDRINPEMFFYAMSVAIAHRPDTGNVPLPSMNEIFPDRFVASSVVSRARGEANIETAGSRKPIDIPLDFTAASEREVEQRVAYFREDIGINLHHWHWHLVYPFNGPDVIVRKDRRGELFYYMHHQIMARYNTERLCNGLARARPLTNLREPIQEGYFPKLDTAVAARSWPGRPRNFSLFDLNRVADGLVVSLDDMERLRDRVIEAIRTRRVRNSQGVTITLTDETGIDVLGNMIEASSLSPNQDFYGSLHNRGHVIIGYCHDPDHRYLEPFGVMGDSTTAMRDPVFYRWHSFIDNIFTLYKDSLQPYTEQQLNFPGVSLAEIRVTTNGGNPNTLSCHWNKSDIDMSRGLDFAPRGAILARIQHLNHDEFTYQFVATNKNNKDVVGTVRIFMAPKQDENGRLLDVNEQRMLMIEMDKFLTTLPALKTTTIIRGSKNSAVTIPFESTFRNLERSKPQDQGGSDRFNLCGCGWPQHMLIPKGNAQGFPMDMFVMISNYQQDRINQPNASGCAAGVSYCGLRDRKYPDARPMGYPFDRKVRQGARTMNEFLTPNMKLQPITIRFSNIVKARPTRKRQ
ncbi:hypothetical protein QAD02_014953 [Eretmocerus hayati]|uniref:Uncharacterized protein n=1 Tax=Eretmocerus hayati TaxID=131215 RepID=A0ACC2P8I0_9HYME|nr:hypothetical protein QAD02_014953 [Eretmocerus hayati]